MNPFCPVLIIKDEFGLRSKHPSGRIRYAVCTDGSEKSLSTIQFTSRLLDRAKGDEMVAICVENNKVNATTVNDGVNHFLETQGIAPIAKFITLKRPSSAPLETVDQTIVNYLMSCAEHHNYIDFVAVGNHGADFSNHLDDKKYLGSVANGVIRKSNLNVLFFA